MVAGTEALARALKANPNLSDDEKLRIAHKAMADYISTEVNTKFPGSQFVMGWSDNIGFTAHWGGKTSPKAQEFEGQALQGLNVEDFRKLLKANPITVNATLIVGDQKLFATVQASGKEEAERAGAIVKRQKTVSEGLAASLGASSGRPF
jgi:hypothetical protein